MKLLSCVHIHIHMHSGSDPVRPSIFTLVHECASIGFALHTWQRAVSCYECAECTSYPQPVM